mmetsp:Transcript_5279/g.14158  ORF Transcript_5279/g.14158 Transcript_5279/m.14158 type:complete len:239 (+) Transcript_5279:108-824(+)
MTDKLRRVSVHNLISAHSVPLRRSPACSGVWREEREAEESASARKDAPQGVFRKQQRQLGASCSAIHRASHGIPEASRERAVRGDFNHTRQQEHQRPTRPSRPSRPQLAVTEDSDTEESSTRRREESEAKAPNYNKWSREEDELLLSLVDKFGTKRWKLLAERYFPDRRAGSLRSRYVNNLVSSRERRPWTEAEDRELLAGVSEHGNRWSLLAHRFEGRVANDLKNRMQTLRDRLDDS